MIELRFRPLMIIGVIFVTIFSSFTIAGLSELVLPDGNVRHVALALFAGATMISSGGLIWFLRTALLEWERHDEQTRDIVLVDSCERVLVRSDGKVGELRASGEDHTTPIWIPAYRKRPVPLEEAQLDAALYHLLKDGGNTYEHEH